jgi:tRNA dimethylallyltransferase
MPHKPRIIFLVGPTASGKTELAVKLAKKFKLGIISCDSMQVYREARVITNKPSSLELKQAKHHLINIVSVKDNFDAALFLKLARESIDSIIKKGKIPLVVVGTPFYMIALLDGIFIGQSSDEKLRNKLYRQAKVKGHLFLYKRLKKVDPVSAGKIHPHDLRRIIRALEVYLVKKVPISKLQKKKQGIYNDYQVKIYGIRIPRGKLYERINLRTTQLFKKGFVKEAKRLLKTKLSKSASQILGLKEIALLIKGKIDIKEAERLIARNTRHYAKRQLTWFRRDKRIIWKTPLGILKSKRI